MFWDSLLEILLTSSFAFWQNYTKKLIKNLDDFTAAVDLKNDLDAALLALDRIVDKYL